MIVLRRSRRQLPQILSLIRGLPGQLARRRPGAIGAAAVARLAYEVMARVYIAFVVKSGGGEDPYGERWTPLQPATIAARKPPPVRPYGGRGLLTAAQDRQWRAIYARLLARLSLSGMGDASAQAEAAKRAWGVLKAQGAQTRLAALGHRKVDMLVVSGRLAASLRPGRLSGQGYQPPRDQLYAETGGELMFGSVVPYAARQHRQRPFWTERSKGLIVQEATAVVAATEVPQRIAAAL